tara:strand:- start:149 stop:418 length:270 start_codon:yes stop_codon:yes gene_type:complete
MSDNLEIIRRKLMFRSCRRGTKESDLVIGGFAQKYLRELNEQQLKNFEKLLDESDQDVLSWIIGISDPPSDRHTDVLEMLKTFEKALNH